MFEQLKDKIVAMVASLSGVQESFGYEIEKFNGDPAATITPSSNESDYHSNNENERVYAFVVRLWVNRTARGSQEAERVITQLVDNTIDMFDKYYTLGTGSPGAALVIPTGYLMIRTEAIPSSWFYVEREESYRLAEINVKCHVHVDVNSI